MENLKQENYDLGINTLVETCGFGYFYLLGIPAWVAFSPMQNYAGLHYLFGIPQPYVVGHGLNYLIKNENLISRNLRPNLYAISYI